jgi:hypothetical protein
MLYSRQIFGCQFQRISYSLLSKPIRVKETEGKYDLSVFNMGMKSNFPAKEG